MLGGRDAVLRDARDIPAGVPSHAPQHQLGLRHLADALRGGFAPNNGLMLPGYRTAPRPLPALHAGVAR